MKILIDECAPRALKHALEAHGHACLTLQEAGWAGKKNGEFLSLAETKFQVLVTIDTNLRFSTKLKATHNRHCDHPGTLKSTDSSQTSLSPCAESLATIKPGDVGHVGITF